MRNNIIGVGIDILNINRLNRLLENSFSSRLRFIKRILSSEELSSTEWKAIKLDSDSFSSSTTHPRELQYLANRWAAKEAAYKALYPTFKPTWKQLSVLKDQQNQLAFMSSPSNLQPAFFDSLTSKKPIITFQPENAAKIPLPDLHMSLSHDGDYVVAIVVASCNVPTR
ncbi:4'-phosphopantetheinyl transferase superfamily [Melampsora americana]|nr:4'-phosphopantetheinyl transferase superfamily [Melampsora americana]